MTLGANWGATPQEQALPLPCDALRPDAPTRAHRAIDVDAPPPVTFRWLCQLRAAPYSYDLLDNFGRRSPRELTPGLGDLEVGQRFMTLFRLESFARDEHVTLRARGGLVVTYAVLPRGAGSRILVRILSGTRGLAARALLLGDAVMMRKQLRTLRERAEAGVSG